MIRPAIGNTIRAAGRLALLLASPAVLTLQGCTDLEESPLSAITPDNFYRTEDEVIGGLAATYSVLRSTLWNYYNVSEISSDEMVVPTRGSDWFDNGRWLELHYQGWSPTSATGLSGDDINGVWNTAFQGVARANVLLSVLPSVTVADKDIVEAEVRALRAFYYYLLMDMFGGVPIVTDTEIMPRERSTRAELFDWIESELLAAREVLPPQWPAASNGRLTRGAADAILASMYLNAEVWTGTVTESGLQPGTAHWEEAVAAVDRILNSSAGYMLAPDFHDNFAPDNHTSPEIIFAVKALNEAGLGMLNHPFYRWGHYNSGIGGGWNGFSTLAETYYAFDTLSIEQVQAPGTGNSTITIELLNSPDVRHDIFLAGRHYNVETGEPVNDRAGRPLYFNPEFPNGITQAAEGDGARINKWPIDPGASGTEHSNDYAYFRLAEMLLIKAEALNEMGRTAEAIALVNQVRERAFDPDQPLSTAMSQDQAREAILRERHMELTAEAKRRQDLIRHGRYTDAWSFKEATDPYRILMPIPQTQIDANPLLEQNPGY